MAMTFPVRCFTCGKVINGYWTMYEERKKTEHPDVVLDSLGMFKECCRRMFRSHVEERDDVMLLYTNPADTVAD